MAIITASNGYKLRPLADGDHTFMMETLKDFPIGNNTYKQRINEFSNMLYVTEQFNKTEVTNQSSVQAITMVLEKSDSTLVSFAHYRITNKVIEIRMGATHPSHRRQHHSTAQLMLGGEFAYNHLGCTSSWQEIIDNDELNAAANPWRPSLSASETQRDSENRLGDKETVTLNKVVATAAEHEAYRAAHSTWGSITYTIS